MMLARGLAALWLAGFVACTVDRHGLAPTVTPRDASTPDAPLVDAQTRDAHFLDAPFEDAGLVDAGADSAAPEDASVDAARDAGSMFDAGGPCVLSVSAPPACGGVSLVSWQCPTAAICRLRCNNGARALDTHVPCAGGSDPSWTVPSLESPLRCEFDATFAGGTNIHRERIVACPPPVSCSISETAPAAGCGASATVGWTCSGASMCTLTCSSIGVSPVDCAGSRTLSVPVGGVSCTILGTASSGSSMASTRLECVASFP